VWHGIKGFRNSPYGERRIGALTAIKARAPVLGGNFGVWGGLFSTYDCAVKGIRKKEDPYNASESTMCLSTLRIAGWSYKLLGHED
jgi:mitochondrial import inner membrane translocase subunit TIM17